MKKNKTKKTNKKNSNKKAKFSKKHPKIALAIKLIILLIVILIVVGTGIIVGMIYGKWGQDFEISEEELLISGNSKILDANNSVLAELSGNENRKIITLDEMSEYLPKAYVAIEDERFYKHSGVDMKRTAGAIFTYVTHAGSSSFGGSTITQQLVKNITKDDEKSGIQGVARKVKEWAKAYQIEQMLSKEQILEMYLNIIFVGSGNSGVGVGAEYYFNKSAKDLDIVECAFLAGINNAPNSYNPYGDNGYDEDSNKKEKINKRTKTVLSKMLELGYINQEQYDESCKEVDDGIEFEQAKQRGKIYSYHTDATITKVISDIADEKNWSKDMAETYVYGGGLTIYSTQNTDVQNDMETVMEDNGNKYAQKSKKTKDEDGKYVKSQAATVVIDNETGYVVGCVGGLGEKTTSRGQNRATQSLRQTGSAIKPLADVLPGLEEKIITASTMYNDCATEFPEGKYRPEDEGAYKGIISVRSAITTSQNIPFVKIMAELTVPVAKTYLEKMGISTLDSSKDVGLSVAIGGLNKGISPLEMAAAYATIENDGVYRTPLFYTKVEDSEGNVVVKPKQETTEVCSKQNAYILKDLLKSVVNSSNGTANYCKISGIDMAAKTGTTNNHYDRWMCGFTDYYTAATWYGFDKNEYVVSKWRSPAGQIYSAIMNSIHKGKAKSEFKEPDGIVTIDVCDQTGLRATDECSSTHKEIFAKGNEPTECDNKSGGVKICEDSGDLATEYCPNVITKYFSNTIPKETLGLWTNLSGSGSTNKGKAPTKECTEHTKDSKKSEKNSDAKTEIKLNGDKKINLKVGDTYTEKGATATDDVDGDLTNKILISGNVNTSKAGTYTVTYTVTNSRKETVTATRTIVVTENKKQDNTNKTDNTLKDNTVDDNKGTEKTDKDNEKDSNKEEN